MDIDAFIPQPRLARYRDAAGPDMRDVERFYRWCQQLALFADIAALEVAMRSAMARELAATYGGRWYERHDIFDDDAARGIAQAWRQNGLGSLRDAGIGDNVLEGGSCWRSRPGAGRLSYRQAPRCRFGADLRDPPRTRVGLVV